MRNGALSFFFRPRAAKLGAGTAWPWGPGPMSDLGTLGSLGSCMPGLVRGPCKNRHVPCTYRSPGSRPGPAAVESSLFRGPFEVAACHWPQGRRQLEGSMLRYEYVAACSRREMAGPDCHYGCNVAVRQGQLEPANVRVCAQGRDVGWDRTFSRTYHHYSVAAAALPFQSEFD